MGAGIEIYNDDGTQLVFSSATRPTVILGSFTTTTTNNDYVDVDTSVTQDNFFVIITRFINDKKGGTGYRVPKFYVENNKIYWTYTYTQIPSDFSSFFSTVSPVECVYGIYL